ncbi:hypothetical protein C8Q80DRAFT_1271747 [Daedaleopsis nitida]|nr:hypothetical protein C8Q80DRAFT_1271747 [Daedaleopsis nitida]
MPRSRECSHSSLLPPLAHHCCQAIPPPQGATAIVGASSLNQLLTGPPCCGVASVPITRPPSHNPVKPSPIPAPTAIVTPDDVRVRAPTPSLADLLFSIRRNRGSRSHNSLLPLLPHRRCQAASSAIPALQGATTVVCALLFPTTRARAPICPLPDLLKSHTTLVGPSMPWSRVSS